MRSAELFEFIQRRYSITMNKLDGKPKPWTRDPILQKFRFCNVHREDDAVTVWVSRNWRKPNAKDPILFFAMAVARYFNLPSTLEAIHYPRTNSTKDMIKWLNATRKTLDTMVLRGDKVFNPAYIVSTNGMAMVKHHYVLDKVLKPLWDDAESICAYIGPKASLAALHTRLVRCNGVGSFMAGQIIADLKYVQMQKAPDWWTWAASGPGSRRGLNRVCGLAPTVAWRERMWLETLTILHDEVGSMVNAAGIPALHAQDLQNCLCEFDKYERVRLGEGRPKSLYQGV